MKKINVKPKTKKALKIFGLILIAITVMYFIYNVYVSLVTGNQKISTSISDRYYSNSNIIGQIKVVDYEKKPITGNVKFKILNEKNKKVSKNVKSKLKDGTVDFNIPVGELESGDYKIEATVSTNKGKDKILTPIYIKNRYGKCYNYYG